MFNIFINNLFTQLKRMRLSKEYCLVNIDRWMAKISVGIATQTWHFQLRYLHYSQNVYFIGDVPCYTSKGNYSVHVFHISFIFVSYFCGYALSDFEYKRFSIFTVLCQIAVMLVQHLMRVYSKVLSKKKRKQFYFCLAIQNCCEFSKIVCNAVLI